ncbi:NUDIX domain-containing protein, partial [Providencia stuartii]
LGFTTEISLVGHFVYHAEVNGGLIEHEYDHLFIGYYDGAVTPNRDEVSAIRWVLPSDLQTEIKNTPDQFTPWFKLIINKYPLLQFK